jgi:hypothetical protein
MDIGAATYDGTGGSPVAAVTTGGVFCFALTANEHGEWDDPPPGNEYGEWDDPPPWKEYGWWEDPHPWNEYGWWEDPPPGDEYGEREDPPPDPKEVPVPDDDDDELCDALEGIVASAAPRSMKFLVDSGSIIDTCPEEFDPSTETRPPNRCWDIETVTGGSLKHYGFKPNVYLRTKQGIPMKVGFGVTDAKRPILSVKKGAELGSMTIFAPDAAGPGRSMIINDPDAIDEILRVMKRTPGLRIDVENNSYVVDAGVVPKGNRGIGAWVDPPPAVAPVTDVASNANITRALGQAEREQRVDEKVEELHETEAEEAAISHTVEIKAASQPYEPNKAEREARELTCVPYRSWCKYCVAGKAADTPHKKQAKVEEHIPVVEFDYNFIGDKTIDEKKVTVLVAVDSVHGSMTAPMARKKGSSDECVMQALLNYVMQLGFPKAELKCDQEPSAVDVMCKLVERCESTQLVPSASPEGSKGSLGRCERGHLSVQGQVRTLKEATQERDKISIDAEHILVPWMTRHSA